MAGLRTSLWVGAVLAALPAAALAQPSAPSPDPCPVIERLLAAARETPAFASVQSALARGEAVVPGFVAADCRVEAGTGLDCGEWGMAARRFPPWTEPLTCPGLSQRPLQRRPFDWGLAFAAPGGLRVEYGIRCRGCAGPASSYFRIRFDRPGQGTEE